MCCSLFCVAMRDYLTLVYIFHSTHDSCSWKVRAAHHWCYGKDPQAVSQCGRETEWEKAMAVLCSSLLTWELIHAYKTQTSVINLFVSIKSSVTGISLCFI